jgi:hypothetical protein
MTGVTAIDGSQSGFAYNNGGGTLLSSIGAPVAPGFFVPPRTFTFTMTGTDLTRIEDAEGAGEVDGRFHDFQYSSHRHRSFCARSTRPSEPLGVLRCRAPSPRWSRPLHG